MTMVRVHVPCAMPSLHAMRASWHPAPRAVALQGGELNCDAPLYTIAVLRLSGYNIRIQIGLGHVQDMS